MIQQSNIATEPKDKKTYICMETCILIFTEALYIIGKIGNNPKYPLIGDE